MSRLATGIALLLSLAQLTVLGRLIRTARARHETTASLPESVPISVIVPVYDEQARLAPCLEGLLGSDPAVREIVVVDNGSTDRTLALVEAYRARDSRIRPVAVGDPPPGWNGKIWALHHGIRALDPSTEWVVLIDADVRPTPGACRTLVAATIESAVPCASAALPQRLAPDVLSWVLHPAFLTTLVYRFGLPQRVLRSPHRALVSGQFMALHRSLLSLLERPGALAQAMAEDVALARSLLSMGIPVAFLEFRDGTRVQMYRDGREVWNAWPRSLPVTEGASSLRLAWELGELILTQGAWFPLLVLTRRCTSLRWPAALATLIRLGILVGTRRVYPNRRRWYWLSPLADPVVVLRLLQATLCPARRWRGRTTSKGGTS